MPSCPFCRIRTDTGSELQEHITRKHPEEAMGLGRLRGTQRKKFKRREKNPPIVVDGNNVAYYGNNKAEVNNIKQARAILMKEGYSPIIFVSAALRHDIDNSMELTRIINLGWVIEVEGGENDDVLIIEEAQRKQCKIITNDKFKNFGNDYDLPDWKVKDSLLQFTFSEGKFALT